MSQYILGTSERELVRLQLQHEVWEPVTRELLLRAGLRPGMRCLDAGCGPGFATELLRAHAGAGGEVLALDESPSWQSAVEARIRERGWGNVRFARGRLQEVELSPAHFDLIYMRWVLSFLPEPARVLARMREALAPRGVMIVHDYNHEGISLYPPSAGFRAAIRATREWYRRGGGDAFVAGSLPRHLRAAGLDVVEQLPRVICGGPASPAFRWAGAFFPHYSEKLVEEGLMSADEREQFLREWAERELDPDSLFFSPIVTGTIARART